MIVLCRICQLRRVYGRFQDCLACRMDQRDQDNQERRRRQEVVLRRLGPSEIELALNWRRNGTDG
jgi:hypothetical protein